MHGLWPSGIEKKLGFFLLFDAYDALRCATMRYDSASPKTGAWPSLVSNSCAYKYVFAKKTTIQYSPVIESAKLPQLTVFVSSQILFTTVPVSYVIPENEAQSLSFAFNKCLRHCEVYIKFVIVYSEDTQ